MSPTGKTIKAKNLRVPNPDYSPTIKQVVDLDRRSLLESAPVQFDLV